VTKAAAVQLETRNGAPLPRGPHALPKDVVIAHQRERLLEATVEAMAERGYSELSVRELIVRAGVSRRTFYQFFDDKLDCVFAAHQMAFSLLSRAIVDACGSQTEWPQRVDAAIGAALDFAAERPNEAHLIVVSCHTASEPSLASRGRVAHEKLAALLKVGRRQVQDSRQPPVLTEQAVIGAAMSVVGVRLLAGEAEELPKLHPELSQIILAPYIGDREARRVALAVAG
jgi:AcrR family transcriptional regulator